MNTFKLGKNVFNTTTKRSFSTIKSNTIKLSLQQQRQQQQQGYMMAKSHQIASLFNTITSNHTRSYSILTPRLYHRNIPFTSQNTRHIINNNTTTAPFNTINQSFYSTFASSNKNYTAKFTTPYPTLLTSSLKLRQTLPSLYTSSTRSKTTTITRTKSKYLSQNTSLFNPTRPQFLFQQGLGKAHQSRSRLGSVSKPEAAKVVDPLGTEAKQKRLEAQLQAMKEGKEYDQFAGLTAEQKAKQIEYLTRMKNMEETIGLFEFIFSQSSTYYMVWFTGVFTIMGLIWWGTTKVLDDPENMTILNNSPGLRNAMSGLGIANSKELNQQKLKALASEVGDDIADDIINKYHNKSGDGSSGANGGIGGITHQTHGRVEGIFSPTKEQQPKAAPWDTRRPIIHAFTSSGLSYPDYVGGGHFHIYHNGRDPIPDILARVQKDNHGMTFTFQVLSFVEAHQMMSKPLYKPRTLDQLDRDSETGIDSSKNDVTGIALNVLDEVEEEVKREQKQ